MPNARSALFPADASSLSFVAASFGMDSVTRTLFHGSTLIQTTMISTNTAQINFKLTFATFTFFLEFSVLLLILSSLSHDDESDEDDDEESVSYPSSSSGVINDDNFPTRSLSLSGKSGSLIFPSQITTAVNVCPSLSATILQ